MKRTLAVGLFAILAFTTAPCLLAQSPFVGTWKLNVAKSKYTPGPAPKSLTRTVESQGDKMKFTFAGVPADGIAVTYTFTVTLDGKDYPITGSGAPGGADTMAVKQLSPTSSEATLKKAGEPILISKVTVSNDGKITTIVMTSVPGTGSVNNTAVYDKQ